MTAHYQCAHHQFSTVEHATNHPGETHTHADAVLNPFQTSREHNPSQICFSGTFDSGYASLANATRHIIEKKKKLERIPSDVTRPIYFKRKVQVLTSTLILKRTFYIRAPLVLRWFRSSWSRFSQRP